MSLTDDEFEDLLYFWTAEATKASQDIAFLSEFANCLRLASEKAKQNGSHEIDLNRTGIGRTLYRRVVTTSETLILFCIRATDGCDGASIRSLKKHICQQDRRWKLSETSPLKTAFEIYFEKHEAQLVGIKELRNKFVAHSDRKYVLRDLVFDETPNDIIHQAKMICELIERAEPFSRKKGTGIFRNERRDQQDASDLWNAVIAHL